LRTALGAAFTSLTSLGDGRWRVSLRDGAERQDFDADDAETAYAGALLAELDAAPLR
jgi:hypothetical protein